MGQKADTLRFEVIDGSEDLEALSSKGYLTPGNYSDLADTDFDNHFLVAAFDPQRGSNGYSIRIVDVLARPPNPGGLVPISISVYVKQGGPGPRQPVNSVMTAPCHIVQVERRPDVIFPFDPTDRNFLWVQSGDAVIFRFFLEHEVEQRTEVLKGYPWSVD